MSESNDPLWNGGEQPKADWYPDPSGSGGQRYWDGGAWTDHVRPLATTPQWQDQPAAHGYQQQQQPAIYQHASPKSPGLAIVLSILWLGTGHFYAGRSDTLPIVFAVLNFFLWVFTLFCLIGILAWIPLAIFAAVDARKAAIEFNTRHGLQTGV